MGNKHRGLDRAINISWQSTRCFRNAEGRVVIWLALELKYQQPFIWIPDCIFNLTVKRLEAWGRHEVEWRIKGHILIESYFGSAQPSTARFLKYSWGYSCNMPIDKGESFSQAKPFQYHHCITLVVSNNVKSFIDQCHWQRFSKYLCHFPRFLFHHFKNKHWPFIYYLTSGKGTDVTALGYFFHHLATDEGYLELSMRWLLNWSEQNEISCL